MSELIGSVTWRSRIDGNDMPRQAEKQGRDAGDAAVKGYDKTWSKGFEQTLSESGRKALKRWEASGRDSGKSFGTEFNSRLAFYIKDANKILNGIQLDADFLDGYSKKFNTAGEAASSLQQHLVQLQREGLVNGNTFNAARDKVDAWVVSQRDAVDASSQSRIELERQNVALERHSAILREQVDHINAVAIQETGISGRARQLTRELNGQNVEWERVDSSGDRALATLKRIDSALTPQSLHWRDLSHNTRQWTLIIGAVLASFQDIAVLGSAAGVGLTAVGGAAVSGIAGIGGLAAVFTTLGQDLADLPASVRPVAQEFRNLEDAFSGAREAIAIPALERMPGVFSSIDSTVRALYPALGELGKSVGDIFVAFDRGTRQGSDGFAEINRAIELAGPNVERLADSAGTLGLALLRSFNRAQPAVAGLLSYVDRLVNQFDAFTRSDDFPNWVERGSNVLAHFGGLLDSTGRLLNNLVTPDSINRTNAFLDNLTGFMPSFESLLDILGRADVFGLAAQALNDIGVALSPLAPAAAGLADAFSRLGSDVITSFAGALNVLAAVAAPVVTALTDLVNVIPGPVAAAGVAVFAASVTGLSAALIGIKVSGAISSALSSLDAMGGKAAAAAGGVRNLGSTISSSLGKAGLVGAGIVGVLALSEALDNVYRQISGVDTAARNAVGSNHSFADSYDDLSRSVFGVETPLRDTSAALDRLTGSGFQGMVGSLGNAFDNVGDQANALSQTLSSLDTPIAALAQNNLPAAQQQFSAWATELGATDAQILNMIHTMPQFQAALEAASLASGHVASESDLVALALGRQGDAQDYAAQLTALNNAQLDAMTGAAVGAGGAIDGLAEKIRGFGSATLDSREANRNFQAAVDAVTASVAANGTELDINSEQGRANQAALDEVAQSAIKLAAATYEQTGKQEDATAAIQAGRDSLINQLAQFGITGQAAEDYANDLGLVPDNISTLVDLNGVDAAETRLQNLTRDRYARVIVNEYNQGQSGRGTNVGQFASGGILTGPQKILAGEAGPEMIVPLRRALGQVDPSVRWMSALAQGKQIPKMASGGVVGGGRTVNVAEGAIVLTGVSNPDAAAVGIVTRIVEQVAG